ncbi:MAG TPA: hypothetical protein VFV99_22200 [Kofleriaceae bacterium]|nr:hypothetical protein [Kofleriaceae bacterium]
MNARRDALAHRFVAFTHDETQAWPADLQVSWHELAFSTLPELILELDAPAACRFARSWRERVEAQLATPAPAFDDAELAWLNDIARGYGAAEPVAGTSHDVTRLADLLRRFGPLALSLPWRHTPPAKA